MRSKLQLLFIFIVVIALGGSALAQGIGDRNRPSSGGSHNIIGTIILPNGRPAVGVRVSLGGADFTNNSATTDQDGKFTFSGIPGGNYEINVRADGYQNERESLTIERFASPGQSYQMTIHLRQPGQESSSGKSAARGLEGVPKNAAAKFESGMQKLAKNDAKGAIGDFDAAIAAHPQFALAHYERGAAYLKLADFDKATESFVKAITIKPDYVEAKYGYGLAQFNKKAYEVSSAVFDDVLKQKKMPEAHMYLGMSLYHLKNVDAAEAHLKAAVVKDGENVALAHRYLGGIYAQKKRNAEAAAELQKYLELAPKAPDADKLKTTIENLKKQS